MDHQKKCHDVPQAISRKKTYMDEQSRIAPQKPNRRTPRARFSGGRGFRRHLLSRYSVRAEVRDEEARGLLRCGFSRERLWKEEGLTEDVLFYAYDGEKESQRRNPGDGDTKRRGNRNGTITLPPP